MATSKEIKDGYTSTLQDLTCNSKPLISVLTMLAEENVSNAKDIVEAIEAHLTKVRPEVKLPVLYLIDCIIKNVGGPYTSVFCSNIVPLFCGVFQVVDEKTRTEMYKLRQTWNDVLPKSKLYNLDVQTHQMDPAWPITAPPPNIHFNPKFLNSSQMTKNEINNKTPIVPTTTTPDPATLDMQQQLIIKQKELLELQQRKLELELLQTQVKLQEQIKKTTQTEKKNVSSKNLLLKPEVAKQMEEPSKSTMRQNLQQHQKYSGSNNNSVPRIAPVGNALIAAVAVRPIRDPRLLRQQQQQQAVSMAANQQQNTVNLNVQLENKSNITNTLDNKLVTNRMSARFDKKNDARFVNNKDELEKNLQNMSRIPLKNKRPSLPNSNNKSKSSRSSSKSSSGGGGSGSTSSLDSPTKKTSRASSKSPAKYKKSNATSNSVTTPRTNNEAIKKIIAKVNKNNSEHGKAVALKDSGFKDATTTKGLIKNRNYVRRNRDTSLSPERHDVDLRVGGPPEKQPRTELAAPLTADSNDETCDIESIQGMDVDLRQLPATLGKKRLSTETCADAPNSKKSKSQMFDVLFGNEDVDLRQLSTIRSPKDDRPPTPPAPIISNKFSPNKKNKNEKENNTNKDCAQKINLDALRAKLANATNQDKINNSKINVAPDLNELLEPTKAKANLDDSVTKIIISPADEECIKTGNMTKNQEQILMNKIIAQIESQSLKEAKRKESENEANISLQPISDDELEESFNREPEMHLSSSQQMDKITEFRIRRGMNVNLWRSPPSQRLVAPPMRGGGYSGVRELRPWIRPTWKQPPPTQQLPQKMQFPREDNESPDLLEQRSNSPQQSEMLVNYSNQDSTKSINIDNEPRDIIFYDETAVAFMSPDDPREISFQNGSRRIHFDKDSFNLVFNEVYKDVLIDGNSHKIRLGSPTREVYIDGKWYECYFGGPGIGIELNGKLTVVKIDGPPPQVKIGMKRRTDLVAGKINLIIDAKTIVPVYLDARPQTFEIANKVQTLKFTDALMTVLINDVPFKVEFGGLPKPIVVNDKKHFVRFSVLPRGIKPGYVNIKDMEGERLGDLSEPENSLDAFPLSENTPTPPIITKIRKKSRFSDDRQSPIFNTFENLDLLSHVMMQKAAKAPTINSGYQIENEATQPQDSSQSNNNPSILPPNLNINDLFQKLIATGIVSSTIEAPINTPTLPTTTTTATTQITPAAIVIKQQIETQINKHKGYLKSVDFTKAASLKFRQPALVHMLYSGLQCSSCGMRFPPENSVLYSQHLDWHFRQNRKGKKNIRKATSRRWYYSIADWNNYEEIEDLEEREKCYFDSQQDKQTEGSNDENEEEIEVPSVPADADIAEPQCEVCREKFEQFYNEEKEEWHLRVAIRIDEKTYHPLCYEDHQASLMEITMDESINKTIDTESIPGLDVMKEEEKVEVSEVIDIDLDSMESVANTPKTELEEKETELKEIDDKVDVALNGEATAEADDEDDDVIINEVVPERIILDEYEFIGNVDDCLIPGVVVKEEPIDDGFMDIENFKLSSTKIKDEPTTPDESFEEIPDTQTSEELSEAVETKVQSPVPAVGNHPELVTSIDGNVELNVGVPPSHASGISGKIKINISKPLPVIAPKENKDISLDVDSNIEPLDPSQPLPPGEEPVQLNLKPALQGIELKKLPPVNKGSELTGLCSIM